MDGERDLSALKSYTGEATMYSRSGGGTKQVEVC